MAVSDDTRSAIGRRTSRVQRTSRYDLHLMAIPLIFAVAVLVGVVASITVQTAVFAASLVGAVIVVDGLFVNPPDVSETQ